MKKRSNKKEKKEEKKTVVKTTEEADDEELVKVDKENLSTILGEIEDLLDITRDIKVYTKYLEGRSFSDDELNIDLGYLHSKAKYLDRALFLIFDKISNLHHFGLNPGAPIIDFQEVFTEVSKEYTKQNLVEICKSMGIDYQESDTKLAMVIKILRTAGDKVLNDGARWLPDTDDLIDRATVVKQIANSNSIERWRESCDNLDIKYNNTDDKEELCKKWLRQMYNEARKKEILYEYPEGD